MKPTYADEFIQIAPQKIDAHFSGAYDKDRSDNVGIAKYFLHLDITSLKETVYIPVSAASGRRSTGFIYQIEGTGEGEARASVNARGEGTILVTSGSITYCKIPAGKTASFKLLIQVSAPKKREYEVVISRVNYKFNTNDPRYQRFLVEIGTKTLRFR